MSRLRRSVVVTLNPGAISEVMQCTKCRSLDYASAQRENRELEKQADVSFGMTH
jgi:hypothetical protein